MIWGIALNPSGAEPSELASGGGVGASLQTNNGHPSCDEWPLASPTVPSTHSQDTVSSKVPASAVEPDPRVPRSYRRSVAKKDRFPPRQGPRKSPGVCQYLLRLLCQTKRPASCAGVPVLVPFKTVDLGDVLYQMERASLDFSNSLALMISICRRFSMLAKLVSGS